jgi:FkbM family methyltransferase
MKTKTKIRLASAASRSIIFFRKLFGYGRDAIVIRNGIRWHLDLDEGIDFSIYLLGAFERSTVNAYRKFLPPGGIALDIGANIGAHTLPMAQAVGTEGRVYAFEPTRYAFSKLARNISLNPALASRICLEQTMLSDKDNSSPPSVLYSSWSLATAGGSRHPKHLGQLKDAAGAMVRKLDSRIDQLGLDRIDFIKIDVDGNECEVFRGAQRTLARYRPKILMEFMPYGLEENGHSMKELVDLLKDAGYGIVGVPRLHALPENPEELNNMIPDGSSINVLCLPAGTD